MQLENIMNYRNIHLSCKRSHFSRKGCDQHESFHENIPNKYGYHYSQPYNQRLYPTLNDINKNFTIKVWGKGVVLTKPDQAVLSIGVETEDKNVQNAQQQNATISNQVIIALLNVGIKQDEIETASYNIEQLYDYPNGQQVFRGYKVTHMFKVMVKDTSKIGEVIDVAVQNGTNVIRGIEFEVSNPDIYYEAALKKATLNAKNKAESIANALGLSINSIPVWIVEESVEVERPPFPIPLQAAAISEATTPIQEGDIKTIATVQALFNYKGF
jgi:uncharacterized protein YggE